MQWSDVNPLAWFLLLTVAVVILVFVAKSQSAKRLREVLEMMAREMGWSDVKWSSFFTQGVQGTWNGYSVRVRRLPRQKNVPERIVSSIRVQAPARLTITRRQRGVFGGRPLAWFGPPLVELPLSSEFWIRADEITLADRLMHSSAAAMLDRILQSRHDFLRLAGDQLLVQRATTSNPDETARLAREELELLRSVIDALALRP